MKYGESLFNRTRDTRPTREGAPAAAVSTSGAAPGQPAANAPTHSPAPGVSSARAASATAQADARHDEGGSKLIVGPNIKLKGVEIHDCDTLVVEGRVEATMVSRTIQIAENGTFEGKVDVDVAEVHGGFQGELTARRKLVIHATGRVAGKIRYGKILVQEGGVMSGDVGSLPEVAAVAKS